MDELNAMLQPDNTVKLSFNDGRESSKRLLHIRALVDDQVVYREWSDEFGWMYFVNDLFTLVEWYENGYLT